MDKREYQNKPCYLKNRVAGLLVDPKGLPFFSHIFSVALYHKWDVKNDFAYIMLQFSRLFLTV